MRILIAAFLLCPLAAQAGFFNGNEIYEQCQDDPLGAGIYASGLIDGALTMQKWDKGRPSICPASGVTVNQVGDVMCKHLEENPAERHLTASSIALNVFETAWPCSD